MSAVGKHPSERMWGIEACRGIAALMVVLNHIAQFNHQALQSGVADFQINPMFEVGRTGVDFFFVLSGFIIYFVHRSDIGRPDRTWRYFSRRLTRLIPAYWICTLLFVLLTLYSPTETGREQDPLVILKSLLFIPQPEGPVISVGWSLEHEMFFYCMFALLIMSRRIGMLVFAVWIGAVAWRYCIGDIPHPFRHDWFGFHAQFLIGIAVAEIILRGWVRWSLLALGLGLAGFLFGFWMQWDGVYATNSLYGKITFGLASGVLLYGVAGMDLRERWRVPNLLRVIGDSTYSLYLTHGMGLIILGEILQRLDLFAVLRETGSMILAVVLITAGAIVFTRLVEKPAIEVMRSLLRPSRPVPATP